MKKDAANIVVIISLVLLALIISQHISDKSLTAMLSTRSPNGKYAARAVLNFGNSPYIEIMKMNGKTVNQLYEYNSSFLWLNDSSGILVGIYQDGLYYIPVNRQNPRQLLITSGGNYDHNPTPSLDGKWIYFLHHEMGTECTVYRIKTKRLLSGPKIEVYEECQKIKTLHTTHDQDVRIVPRRDGGVKLCGYCVIYPQEPKEPRLN